MKKLKRDSFLNELTDNFEVMTKQVYLFLKKKKKILFLIAIRMLLQKGLVTLIASIYSDEKAEDIVSNEIDLMEEFELGVILSPARRNGAYSMLKTIKQYAKNLAT